ncbi:MAG: hypothetical protein K8F62_14110, partial [Pseudorhodoplanes sp.]|nr:hypothetical protein [Pseudorhodoplanes sp.]
MTLHLWKNSSAIAVLAYFIACGSALAGPNSISISPSIGGFSSMRAPDISMRSRDNRDLRGVIAPPESNAGSKKAKKTGSGNSNTKKATGTGNAARKKIAAPVASTPPVTGAKLGLTPADRKIQDLLGKIDVPALGAVQDAAVLPDALGAPGGDNQGLADSPRDPASAGWAKTLPSFTEQAGQDAGAGRTLQARMIQRVEGEFVPRSRRSADGPVHSTAGQTPGSQPGTVGAEPTHHVWTWEAGPETKVTLTQRIDGRGGFQVTVTEGGRDIHTRQYDGDGLRMIDWYRNPDGGRTETLRDAEGEIMWTTTYDARGNVVSHHVSEGWQSANPTSAGSGQRKQGSSGPVASTSPSGNTNPAGNTTSSGGGNTTSSGGGNTTSSGSGNTTSSGGGNTVSSSGNTTSDRSENSNDNSSGGDKPTNDIGPSKDSSQPAEGTDSNRNFFYEKGIVNAGDRPKQAGHGFIDRNVPGASGVIIQRDGPPTP